MSRKLISFLGNGRYELCRYSLDGWESEPVKYVQLAMAEIFKPDRVLVFTTKKACEANYTAPEGLKVCAARRKLQEQFANVDIPDGTTQDEIWQIFSRILDHVEQDDEIWFDITYSFRSIPVISLACFQYVRALKNVKLRGIYYGAFDAKDIATGIAPIFDLTPFVELMDWSQATAELVRHGQVGLLSELVEARTLPRRKASRGTDEEAKTLTSLSTILKTGIQWLTTCRGRKIYEEGLHERLHRCIEDLKALPATVPPFYPLLDSIEQKVATLKGPEANVSDEVRRGFGAVDWCLDHNLVQQAYTLLQETLVTHYCRCLGMDYTLQQDRDIVSLALAVGCKAKTEWRENVLEHLEVVEKIHTLAGRRMLEDYASLSGFRNDINHAGSLHNATSMEKISQKIKELYPRIIQQISKEGLCRES